MTGMVKRKCRETDEWCSRGFHQSSLRGSYIKKGSEQGAKLAYGGDRHGDKGYYIQPTVFTDVTDDMVFPALQQQQQKKTPKKKQEKMIKRRRKKWNRKKLFTKS